MGDTVVPPRKIKFGHVASPAGWLGKHVLTRVSDHVEETTEKRSVRIYVVISPTGSHDALVLKDASLSTIIRTIRTTSLAKMPVELVQENFLGCS
jgi:2-hydroxychromene-2-carboxylate isomerase